MQTLTSNPVLKRDGAKARRPLAPIHFGVPLACDFLKECGWTQYAKADVHTKKILEHVGFSDGSDYDTFKAIQAIARHVKETPYAVDKHIWLIGSGNLYNKHETFPTSREEFFRFVDHHGDALF